MLVTDNVVGVQLCKVFLNDLLVTEAVMFSNGASAVDMVLRRARISGRVEPLDTHADADVELGDFWADLLDGQHDIVGHVALDAASFHALKGHWMRCRYVRPEADRKSSIRVGRHGTAASPLSSELNAHAGADHAPGSGARDEAAETGQAPTRHPTGT